MEWRRTAEAFALLAVLTWGGILRLGWPGVNPFAFDEARLSLLALEITRRGHLPGAGLVSSAGVPNFPASVWPFIIPFAFSNDPLVAVVFTGTVSLACVFFLWWMARSAWGSEAGLVTALLAAGSPYWAFYSRSIWGQNWLPIVAVAWAFSGAWGMAKGNRLARVISGLLAGIAFQVHYAGFVLLAGWLFLCLRDTSEERRFWLVGMGIALMIAVLSGPGVIRTVLHRVGEIKGDVATGLEIDLKSPGQFIALATGYNWDWLFVGRGWNLSTGPVAMAIGVASGMLIATGLMGLVVKGWRGRREPLQGWTDVLSFLVPMWALLSPLLWLIHIVPVHIHYHLISLPAAFLAAGYTVTMLPRRALRFIAILLALVLSLGQGLPFIRGIQIASSRATPGGISAPLRFHRAAVDFVSDGTPVVVVTPGDNPDFHGDAAVLHTLLWGYPHRLVDGRYNLILPSDSSWLLFVAPWIPAWEEASVMLAEGTAEVFFIPRREGEYPYVAVKLKKAEPQGFHPVETAPLANGAQLLGWKVRTGNDGFRFLTLWKLTQTPPQGDFHQFNHLYVGETAEPVEIRDVPVSSRAWRKGDYLITWADFAERLGEERAMMAVGMYRYPSLERVPRMGVGKPTAPIWVGPINGQ